MDSNKDLETFRDHVFEGLGATPKQLSSKYFYDDEGSRLFQQIMELPEYYLTECEREIFSEQTEAILDDFLASGPGLDLVELGAGDGSKTAILLKSLIGRDPTLKYHPIDISEEAVTELETTFRTKIPELPIDPHVGDYFAILDSLKNVTDRRKIILFLGSNIGNFAADAAAGFFSELRRVMNAGDLLFLGFDLQKNPRVIQAAYDDASGVTGKFNLNLLDRINRELGADFNKDNFLHYANYRPVEGSARSYLISKTDQNVTIGRRTFSFDRWEAIFMEISQKYTLAMIEDLARAANFSVVRNFFDKRGYYCNSLWRPEPR